MEYFSSETFNYSICSTIPDLIKRPGNPRGNKKIYLDTVAAFDIETSKDTRSENSFMYLWQMQIGTEYTILGRTWDEYRCFIEHLQDSIPSGRTLVIYVHNLSHEFQYIKSIHDFTSETIFAINSRKVAKASIHKIEFRCSYILSNLSLDQFLKKMNVKNKKGSLDYSVVRYPWTKLTKSELEYCINDVLGLVQAIYKQLERFNDNLYSIPMTSTGYVRREVKQCLRGVDRRRIQGIMPDFDTYCALRESFRGGDTHSNRFYNSKIVKDVTCYDITSAYPAVMVYCKFPVTKFTRHGEVYTEYMQDMIYKRGKAVVMRVSFSNIELIDHFYGCPYIAKHKCRNTRKTIVDNGRIIESEYLETTITDVDFKNILTHYKFKDMCVIDMYSARYGFLPNNLRNTIIKYFHGKTKLKGVDETEYSKFKELINAIYGMAAQDPVKISMLFNKQTLELFEDPSADPEEILKKQSRSAVLPYHVGVWTTAWTRMILREGINFCGDKYLYNDTDSIYTMGDLDIKSLNSTITEKYYGGELIDSTDPKGKKHTLGWFENDGHYKEFVTLGAKKYCKINDEDKLILTVSGVNKKLGAAELMNKGGITEFKEGFVFKEGGSRSAKYNEIPENKYLYFEDGKVEATSNVYIEDVTYTLGLGEEYKRIIQYSKSILGGLK